MKIEKFALHNNRQQSVIASDLLKWQDPNNHPSGIFGPVVKYSWSCEGQSFLVDAKGFWSLLPDSQGFICFEQNWQPNNCTLRDAHGQEYKRLEVPWQMVGITNLESTTFGGVESPYVNPATGQIGSYGVSCWINQAKFYLELDFQTGEFLWCKPIRD